MIVVTGAAGFIGSAFVWELNQKGQTEILCADDFHHDHRWKNLAKRQIRDFIPKDDLPAFLARPGISKKVQAIVHMGANSSTTETDVDSLMRTNYFYSQQLFDWAAKNRKTFIYASSAATYGAGEKGYDDSTSPEELAPLNAYGYSKVLFDRWVLKQSRKPQRWIGIKFFNVFGPQEYHKGPMSSVAFKAFGQIREKGSLRLFKSHNPEFADGHQKRDFIYIKDCTRWMKDLMVKKVPNGIYNMGYGQARTWLDLAQAAFLSLNVSKKIEWIEVPENIRNQYQYFTEANMKRALKSGFSKPEWPLEKAIADYYKNYLMTDDWYL